MTTRGSLSALSAMRKPRRPPRSSSSSTASDSSARNGRRRAVDDLVHRIEPEAVDVVVGEPLAGVLHEVGADVVGVGAVEVDGRSPGRAVAHPSSRARRSRTRCPRVRGGCRRRRGSRRGRGRGTHRRIAAARPARRTSSARRRGTPRRSPSCAARGTGRRASARRRSPPPPTSSSSTATAASKVPASVSVPMCTSQITCCQSGRARCAASPHRWAPQVDHLGGSVHTVGLGARCRIGTRPLAVEQVAVAGSRPAAVHHGTVIAASERAELHGPIRPGQRRRPPAGAGGPTR